MTQQQAEIAISKPIPTTEDEWLALRQSFQRHGFVYLKDFFTPEETRLLTTWAEEISAQSRKAMESATAQDLTLEEYILANPTAPVVVPEARDPTQICRAEDFVTPTFDAFLSIPKKVAEVMKSLFGEEYIVFKDKLNFKWPGGGAFPPHQDFPAYQFLDATFHATAMLTIDPASVENGCLRVPRDWISKVEGDKQVDQEKLAIGRAVLPFHKGGKSNGNILEEYSDRMEWMCLNTEPSELVIFSSFVPHYSEVNDSNKPRRAMFLTYNRQAEGLQRDKYYHTKRHDQKNPMFHIATPTQHDASMM